MTKGRPKGSKNIPKSTNSLQVLKMSKDIAGAALTKPNTSYGFVNWGYRNDYPLQLLSLYQESPTHHACISFEVQGTIGGGIDYDAMALDGQQTYPNYAQSYDELLRSITLDYFLYGSYALEIIKNKDDKTFSFWHIDLSKVRWTEYDEDGQITKYAISKDWKNLSNSPITFLNAFDMRDGDEVERGKPYLYVYRPYSPTMDYYTSPSYVAALKAIQAEIEYLNFDLRTTVNNFVPSGMLILNEVETDEQRKGIIDNVQNMFTGTENAASVMVQFRSNVEEVKPEFIPFQSNTSNVNLYDAANTRNINRILAAHQIPNASLVGMPDVNGTGFASEADKLEVGFNLWNLLCGNYHRNCIVGTINSMFRLNGIDTQLVLKPLRFSEEKQSDNEDAAIKEQNTQTNNIEEKVEGEEENVDK